MMRHTLAILAVDYRGAVCRGETRNESVPVLLCEISSTGSSDDAAGLIGQYLVVSRYPGRWYKGSWNQLQWLPVSETAVMAKTQSGWC